MNAYFLTGGTHEFGLVLTVELFGNYGVIHETKRTPGLVRQYLVVNGFVRLIAIIIFNGGPFAAFVEVFVG